MGKPIIDIERKFRIEIEGLRFVAALLVAIYHVWFNRISGGVDVFFVISGFLITSSIISSINRTGEFEFWPYISKLMKRLFPAVFFTLAIVLVLSHFLLPQTITHKTIQEIVASMFYYENWQLAISSTDYLNSSQMKTPVQHFWALSIQGQFYLIWFIIFTFILYFVKKFNVINVIKVLNIILLSVFSISLVYSIYLTNVNQPLAYFHTFTRLWEFALGGLVCINLSYFKPSKTTSFIIGWLGLIGLILTGIIFDVSNMFPGYIALWPMVCAVFIILSSEQKSSYGVNILLGSKMMVKLGGISFGIYLWHWILLQFYYYNFTNRPDLFVGILIIILSILFSYLMTTFIEKPIRYSQNRSSFAKLGALLTINVFIIVSFIVSTNMNQQHKLSHIEDIIENDVTDDSINDSKVDKKETIEIPNLIDVFNDLPISHLDGSNQGLKSSEVKVGVYGKKEDYDYTIALVGSSTSEHWLGAIIAATKSSNYRVLSITRSGTRFSTGYSKDDLKAEWVQRVIEYLEDADVDLVISNVTASDTTKDRIQQQMIEQLLYVKNNFNVEALAVRDVPRYDFNVLETLDLYGLNYTIDLMNNTQNQKDQDYWNKLESDNKLLHMLDLTENFKVDGEFRPIIDNIVVYRDNKHITNTFSESLSPIFESKINKVFNE